MNEIFDPKRTLDQNRLLWPLLRDFAQQIPWHHTENGKWVLGPMQAASWKAVLTAAFERETEMAAGIDGGQVMVGASTSNYGIRKMADFLNFMYAQGNEMGVQWSRKSEESIAQVAGRKAA